jgi:copper chaperone CopZ
MKWAWTAALLVVAVGLVSCRRVDLRTARIYVPNMKNRVCAERVANAVARVPGVRPDSIKVDATSRDVTVLYDSINLSLKNIEYAIADAGFGANDIPANPAAAQKLPPECK